MTPSSQLALAIERAFVARDVEDFEACTAETLVVDDRRAGIAAHYETRSMVMEGFWEPPGVTSSWTSESVAIARRGTDLCLRRAIMRSAAGYESEFLALFCIEGETVASVILFDPDGLDSALAELDRLHG